MKTDVNAGENSDINVVGSYISGKKSTALSAENAINLLAKEQHHQERSKNKSSGFNAGVAVSYGSNGFAFGITAGGNYGKGYGNGDETSWLASKVGSLQSQTSLSSQKETNIKGSQVLGNKINLKAQNLNIESLQDTMTYKGKQMNVSGQVTVGYGFSASGSYNQSKVNADYASVKTQAGLFAGNEGFDVEVKKHTDLKGAVITSTSQAEQQNKNRFSTGTLTYSDIENLSRHNASGFGISGSVAMNFETPLGDKGIAQSNKQAVNDKGEPIYIDKNGNDTPIKTDQIKLAEGKSSFVEDVGFGVGYDKESKSSITKSGIGTANIYIKDEKAQFEKTGKTVEQTLSEIKTDTTTETAESRSGKLENTFDKEKVLKELNIQVKATQDFRKNAFSTIDAYVLPKQAKLREQIKQAKTEEEKTALYNEIYKLQYQKRLLETVVGIVAGSPEVAITQGTLQLAATKMREETLANSRIFKGIKDEKTGQVLRNDSYDSSYFDGVKLGGIRINLDVICNSGMGTCTNNNDGTVSFIGNGNKTLKDAIDPSQNEKAADLYGETDGFQSVEGEWNLHFTRIPYSIGSLSDQVVESFAGTHDMIGGQIWGWYDKQGNTLQNKNIAQHIGSTATTVIAIPVTAPFAVSDAISPDFMEILFKLGGN